VRRGQKSGVKKTGGQWNQKGNLFFEGSRNENKKKKTTKDKENKKKEKK
jgi:hypothetical protein